MGEDESQTALEALARARIEGNRAEIERSLRQIAAGNPMGAEWKPRRVVDRLQAKTGQSRRDSEAIAAVIEARALEIDARTIGDGLAPKTVGAERLQGPTIDFVGVEFLEKGRRAANAVGRVRFRSGRAQGTGFLVGPDLFITNQHVIQSEQMAASLVVEFDYETDGDGRERAVTSFAFDGERCFVSDAIDQLDFTLIAIGPRIAGSKMLSQLGYIPLSDAPDKHALGELANIIQHPRGALKQVVVRENNLVSRDETHEVLHYMADTEPGSSGSPVCNNNWEPIALHHWGGPALEINGPDGRALPKDINEGIRISAIVKHLRRRVESLSGANRAAVEGVLRTWDTAPRRGPIAPDGEMLPAMPAPAPTGAAQSLVRVGADGSLTWTFPIEITIRTPLMTPHALGQVTGPSPPPQERAAVVPPPPKGPLGPAVKMLVARPRPEDNTDDLASREGYQPGFIKGFVVPLPDTSAVPYRLAINQTARPGEDRHELPYRHFSIVMNAERRLAAFTACNIDGSRIVRVKREDKSIKRNPTLADLQILPEGAEASDDFSADPRVLLIEQMTVEFYENQEVPGFPKPKYPGKTASKEQRSEYARAMSRRTARMFQKGHIIMRGDPAWGEDDAALSAESDTFYYTNAAPQLGFFNQGSEEKRPGSKGTLRWRAVETYILRSAVTMRQRVSVFAGPIFDDDDPDYRMGSKVPMRFWKIAVWADQGELRSIAVVADQRPVLEELTKGMPEGMPEAFEDEDELARMTEFLTTVAKIERWTKLDFGEAVRAADVRAGLNESVAVEAEPSILRPPPRPAGGTPNGRTGRRQRPRRPE